MDIHKPKPWHGAREFLKEYVIIVVGVLTALAGEQVVELLHVGQEVREAREVLHTEIAADATIAAASIEEDRCLGLSLDRYEAWARGGPKAEQYRGAFPYLPTSTWEEVRSGAVTHMPLKERVALAQFYDVIANQRAVIEYERNAYLPLIGMSQKPELDKASAERLLELTATARLFGRTRSGIGEGLIATAKALGAPPKPFGPVTAKRLAWQCGGPPP
jgi:hypothetical protein